MTTLATVTAGEGADTVVNQNLDAISAAGMYGRRAVGTSGLIWGYYGGRGFGNTIANGTIALAGSSTNYVVANRSTGVVSVATTTTNWNNSSTYYRLYLIVTGAATVSSYTDYREFFGGGGGGGGISPVVTESTANLNATGTNAGNYTRFVSSGAKTYTFDSAETYTAGDEYHGRNAAAGNLTLTAAGGMTLHPPAGGTLVIPEGGTFTVKIVAAGEADVFGATVAL